MTDPRIQSVEENLLQQGRVLQHSEIFQRDSADDVIACWSDIPFPMYNLVMDARFDDTARVESLADAYVARGLPCLWWATPSTTPPGLHDALLARGFEVDDTPGMHRSLEAEIEYDVPHGVTIEQADVHTMLPTFMEGFGMPDFVAGPFRQVFQMFPRGAVAFLVAYAEDEPVATGAAYFTGQTAGLYNITTLDSARGRGIGTAVTAALMELARKGGCTEAILHASEDGLPVYQKLGFETVCNVPQYVWVPSEATAGA
jgi:GNAT superfamily N-acetyltransferase